MPKFTVRCGYCGNVFIRQDRSGSRPIYCSPQCHYRGRARKRELRDNAIQLGSGLWTLVSEVDIDYLRRFNWVSSSNGYARRGGLKSVRMHRAIMERKIGRHLSHREEVDHINGNPLDNRRSNLRVGTHAQNMSNQRNRRLGKSGYVGVRKLSDDSRWRSYLVLDGQQVTAGIFDNADDAAWMRDQWAIALHEEFARLNFEYIEVETQNGIIDPGNE